MGKTQPFIGLGSEYYIVKDISPESNIITFTKDNFIIYYYNNGNLRDVNIEPIKKEYDGTLDDDTLYKNAVLYQIATNQPPDVFKDLHRLAIITLNNHKEIINDKISRLNAIEYHKYSARIIQIKHASLNYFRNLS